MLIPQSLYGLQRDVKKTCRHMVTQLRRGARWPDALVSDTLLDTNSIPGWLVLSGPSLTLSGEPHFQMYQPLMYIREALDVERLPQAVEEMVFTAALETAWGTLCLASLASGTNTRWVLSPTRFAPFLAAVRRFWQPLAAVGPRYAEASVRGYDLWTLPNNIKFVLARSGVPQDILNSPLPPGGIAALLDRLPEWQANAPVYPEGA